MVNPERDIHVMLWYNGGTEMSCEKYLVKMADMKGLDCGDPFKKESENKAIWVLGCTGIDGDVPIKRFLAAMSYVKPYDKDAPERCWGKSYNAMHIALVWCPEDVYRDNKKEMEGIVTSLELHQ